MSNQNDPRLEAGFKHKRTDEKVALLLGAMLDQLIKLNAPAAPAAPVTSTAATTSRRSITKAD